MILSSKQQAQVFACGIGAEVISAAVAAAAAAAAAAQQAAAQAKARRAAASAAQQSKQGMPGSAQPATSVADSLLGGLNNGLQNPRIQDLLGSQAKKISVATDKGLDPNMASQPLSPAQPQDGMRPMAMGDPGLGLNQDMQAAFGGQQPELYKKYGSY
jgi:opacity protein-like surface antigen